MQVKTLLRINCDFLRLGAFIDLLFCSDINECDHADKSCGNASCINTPGSFECHCPHGYEFDDELPACKGQ